MYICSCIKTAILHNHQLTSYSNEVQGWSWPLDWKYGLDCTSSVSRDYTVQIKHGTEEWSLENKHQDYTYSNTMREKEEEGKKEETKQKQRHLKFRFVQESLVTAVSLTYSLCSWDAKILCCDFSICVGQIFWPFFCPVEINMDAVTLRLTDSGKCLGSWTLRPPTSWHVKSQTQTHTNKHTHTQTHINKFNMLY